MFRKIKTLLELPGKVEAFLMFQSQRHNETDFIRHLLGSIDLSDARDISLTEQQIKERNASVGPLFKSILEPTIKRFIITQEEWIARSAKTMEELSFGRGTINGLFLLLEELESYYNQNLEDNKPKELIDSTKMFPDLGIEDILLKNETHA